MLAVPAPVFTTGIKTPLLSKPGSARFPVLASHIIPTPNQKKNWPLGVAVDAEGEGCSGAWERARQMAKRQLCCLLHYQVRHATTSGAVGASSTIRVSRTNCRFFRGQSGDAWLSARAKRSGRVKKYPAARLPKPETPAAVTRNFPVSAFTRRETSAKSSPVLPFAPRCGGVHCRCCPSRSSISRSGPFCTKMKGSLLTLCSVQRFVKAPISTVGASSLAGLPNRDHLCAGRM